MRREGEESEQEKFSNSEYFSDISFTSAKGGGYVTAGVCPIVNKIS